MHKPKFKNLEYIRTTWMKDKEWDIYKLPNGKIVGFKNGVPSRIWDNIKDFQFTNKIWNL